LNASQWRPASVLVLRMAGFPFDWLDRLAAPDVVERSLDLLAAEDRLTRCRDRAQSPESRDRAAGPRDRALLRAMARGVAHRGDTEELADIATEYAAARSDHAAAEQAYATAHHDRAQESAARLVGLFRDCPALRDMILVSNEDIHPRLTSWLDHTPADPADWRKKDRANVATLVRYIQRVCAKNDTTSHFGPIATGRLDEREDGVSWRPTGLVRRTALSRWAVDAVARQLCRNPATWPWLRPRRAPLATLADDRVHVARLNQTLFSRAVTEAVSVARPVRLSPDDRALFELCDGATDLRRIAAAVGGSVEETTARLGRLAEIGAVVIGPEMPYGREDALSCLDEWLGGSDAAVRHACQALTDRVRSLETAEPTERPAALNSVKTLFTEITGEPPSRCQSGFYSDRSVFHEHCVGVAEELVLGAPLATRMRTDLGLLYDMFLLRPRWRLALERDLVGGWFASRFGTDKDVTLPLYLDAFLTDLDELESAYRAVDARVAAIGEELEAALLPPDADGHRHHVEPDIVRDLVRRHGIREPAVCNPDLMVAAADPESIAAGRFHLVVGDLHAIDDHLSHGSIAPFVAAAFPHYRAELLDLYAHLLAPTERLADVTQAHLNKTFPRIEADCVDIEAFDRSGRPVGDRLRLGELVLRHTGGALRLRTPLGENLRLMIPPHAWPMLRRNPFAVFGFPVSTDGSAVHGHGRSHLPRIQVGDVVLRRETWRTACGEFAATGPDHDGFLRVQRLRRSLRLARHLYVRCPGEPKPVYCDLDSPLLVRQLVKLAAGRPAADQLELSEMLPGPDELWFTDGDGAARTCEIRYGVFSAG
jgi:hypothetical protein